MSIPETISFDKDGQMEHRGRGMVRKSFLSLVIILVALLAFGIGRLTGRGAGKPVRIEMDQGISNAQFPIPSQASARAALAPIEPPQSKADASASSASVVASKNGTKYHYLSCPGAKQIKEANKIAFASAQAAEAAGYTLAANCSTR